MKSKNRSVTLLNPKFDQPEEIKLGLHYKYLFLGPVAALIDRDYFTAFVIFFLSLFTAGIFWIVFSFHVYKVKIRRKIMDGYRPATKADEALIRGFLDFSDFDIKDIKVARLNSLDGIDNREKERFKSFK